MAKPRSKNPLKKAALAAELRANGSWLSRMIRPWCNMLELAVGASQIPFWLAPTADDMNSVLVKGGMLDSSLNLHTIAWRLLPGMSPL